MGGTVAVRAAAGGAFGGPAALAGVILIDVPFFEGLGSCAPHMLSVVAGRPPEFPSYAAAIDFATRSGRCRNPAAATVSFASMLRERSDAKGTALVWRTNLETTRAHWDGWYEQLDAAFLSLPCPKALFLSHRRPLTAALSVGQAQGKLQVLQLPQAGYAIHEDEPGVLADALLEFLHHFRLLKRPPTAATAGARARVSGDLCGLGAG